MKWCYVAYQGKIAHEIRNLLVFSLVDPRFDNAEGHWLLDNIVVVGDNALVDTAVEQSRGVMTTTTARLAGQSSQLSPTLTKNLLLLAKIVDRHEHIAHALPLILGDGAVILDGGNGLLRLRRRLFTLWRLHTAHFHPSTRGECSRS